MLVLFLWQTTKSDRGGTKRKDDKPRKKHNLRGSGNVDAAFIEKIKELLKVVIPSYSCKEFKYLVVLTLLLVLRTQMSIWLADVNGKVVKAIVEKNFKKFCYRVSAFSLLTACLDFQPHAVFNSVFGSQLGHGLLFQAAGRVVQREDY